MNPRSLVDRFGRVIEYLRVSVTDRCDLRCTYCLPAGFDDFEPPQGWLSFDEIERTVAAFARLGVRRVRLTGGEPLLRKGLAVLVARIARLPGIEDLSLSTNGTQLARHAAALRSAGVTRLNISLDSLRAARVRQITCRDALPRVLDGLMAAKDQGFYPIKINMVVMSGVNDDEVEDMVMFCAAHGFVLRLIEAMPVGSTGRQTSYLDLRPVRQQLERRFGLVPGLVPGAGPARYLRSPDGRVQVGFITAMSQHFCETCNRVRLAVDGTLHTCLGNEFSVALRPLLRAGAPEDELTASILCAVAAKPERHCFGNPGSNPLRFMAKTGG